MNEGMPLSQAAVQFGIGLPALVVAVINRKVASHIKAHPKTGLPVYQVIEADMVKFMEDYDAGMLTNILNAANRSLPKRAKLSQEDLTRRLARRTLEAIRDAKELGVDLADLGEEYFE